MHDFRHLGPIQGRGKLRDPRVNVEAASAIRRLKYEWQGAGHPGATAVGAASIAGAQPEDLRRDAAADETALALEAKAQALLQGQALAASNSH
jgi:hypothetical protein